MRREPRMPFTRRSRLGGVVALVALAVAGCASDAELDSLDPKGPDARTVDNLIDPIFLIAGVILALIFAVTIVTVVKFRERDDDDDDEFPEQIEGNTRLEILWTLVPFLLMAGIAAATVLTLTDLNDADANPITVQVDGEAKEWEPTVLVVGQQWWWEYRYYFDGIDDDLIENARHLDDPDSGLPPADIVTATQMVIPAGTEIELLITSRDVIHSFWIPPLNGKRDAVPGLVSPWRLEADQPGVYWGTCTEFCGLSHSRMQMQVVAVSEADFQSWVDQQIAPAAAPTESAAEWLAAARAGEATDVELTTAAGRGMETFRNVCSSCHLATGINDDIWGRDAEGHYIGADQVSTAAPNLTHFASRTTYAGGIFFLYDPDTGAPDTNQLEAWLRDPPGEKQAYPDGKRGMPNLNLTEEQIDDLVAFLLTLGERPADDIISGSGIE